MVKDFNLVTVCRGCHDYVCGFHINSNHNLKIFCDFSMSSENMSVSSLANMPQLSGNRGIVESLA